MKRKLLEKKLKELGCKFLSHRGSHDNWISSKGENLWVPRHADVNPYTAEDILKQASK